ncbi:hypothetical protein V502_11244 [Pseudogymnoascus sp. VKM F-4520 (FW-2644)]|nr:hypothetical protein V502_11244 [Pseudogymnoascus sp. VKM F-4520 (FW-2644)]
MTGVEEKQDPDGGKGAFALIPSFPYNVQELATTGMITAPDKYAKHATSGDQHVDLTINLENYINHGAAHNGESWDKFEKYLDGLIKDEEDRGSLCYRIMEGLFTCFNRALRLIDNENSLDALIWMTRAYDVHCCDRQEYGGIGKAESGSKKFWHQRYDLVNFKQYKWNQIGVKFEYQSAVEYLLGATVKMAETITNTPGW